jgi:DNA-damage-inducible protein J
MSENAVVRARIDERIKDEATIVLAAMGLTVSDAFRLLLTRVAKEKALPFESLIPNAETIEAMKEARGRALGVRPQGAPLSPQSPSIRVGPSTMPASMKS